MLVGHCHCEKVKWKYEIPLESVTACNCTLCSRYGALWAYGYLGDGIAVEGATSGYQRGSKINSYNFCPDCGCVCYYLSNSADNQGRRRVAVNLRIISNPEVIEKLPIDHFEGRYSFEDLPRDGRCVKDLWF